MKKYKVVLDVETTGLNFNYDRIIEISCIKILKNKPVSFYRTYLNSNINISLEAYKIHGINNKFLKDKPDFYDIAYDFLLFIKGCDLIIHNSNFDINFLNYELNLLGLKKIKNYYKRLIDTLFIARSLFPKKKNSLDDLAKRFNINYNRNYHSAFIDTKILFKVYLNLIKKDKIIDIKKKFIIKKVNYKDKIFFISKKNNYLNKYYFNNFSKII